MMTFLEPYSTSDDVDLDELIGKQLFTSPIYGTWNKVNLLLRVQYDIRVISVPKWTDFCYKHFLDEDVKITNLRYGIVNVSSAAFGDSAIRGCLLPYTATLY